MNADNAEVLRSGGSSGVAGISTFMSRTRTPLSNSTLRIGSPWSPGRTCTCSGSRDGSISLCRQVFGQRGPGSPPHCGVCCASRSFRTSETSLPPPFEMARPRRPTDLLAELVSRSSQHEARPPGVGTATTCRLDLTGPLVSIVPQHPKHLNLLQKHVLPGRGLKAAEHFVFSLRSNSLLQPEALPARSRQTLFWRAFRICPRNSARAFLRTATEKALRWSPGCEGLGCQPANTSRGCRPHHPLYIKRHRGCQNKRTAVRSGSLVMPPQAGSRPSSKRRWSVNEGTRYRDMKTPNDSPKSSRKSRWNPAILALLQHATRDKAAEAAGINTATLYRWQKAPEFQAALLEARREVFGQAMGRVQQASNPAVDTPIEIMNEGEYLLILANTRKTSHIPVWETSTSHERYCTK